MNHDSPLPSGLPGRSTGGIDFARALNAEQYAAVTAPDGPALVLAGAGSGKTRTLTYRVAYLLSKGVRPGEIVLVTFTNKAAREMLHRVTELTGVPGHQLWGGTFHHLGQKTLRIFGESIGYRSEFTIIDSDDSEKLFAECVRDRNSKFLKNKDHPKPRAILDMYSYARNTCLGFAETVRQRYPWNEDYLTDLLSFTGLYRERKQERQLADYDDLLDLWLRLLVENPDVAAYFPNRFKNVLVDEYQDTNRLQASIVDRIGAHHGIMAVGDDAQCIYTWRGADFTNILEFPQRHPGTTIYKIETNYRSTPEILHLANGVLLHQPSGQGFSKELRPVKPPSTRPIVVPVPDPRAQADFVCRRLAGLLDDGFAPGDIAVLYRAHYQALELQLELSRRGVPFVITSGMKFFDQAHVKDIVAHLRIIHNPADTTAFNRVVSLLPKVGDRTCEKLYTLAQNVAAREGIAFAKALARPEVAGKVPADARDDWDELVATLGDLADAWLQRAEPTVVPDPDAAQADLFAEDGPAPRLSAPTMPKVSARALTMRSGPVRPDTLVETAVEGWYGDYLKNLYPSNWQDRREDLTGLVGFATRFDTLGDMLNQLVLLNAETTERALEPGAGALRLTTIHQAKGLEYPVVFVIGLAEGLLPLKRAIENGDVEEERRLFYVAVTRAQDELYLVYPLTTSFGHAGGPVNHHGPSQFLREIPTDRYQLDRRTLDRRWS